MTGEDDSCEYCGGSLTSLDPDQACGCDPPEETYPSPWIWTDGGESPGPGRIDP